MGVYGVIWQAGTNWAGPVRIQIYYSPECAVKNKTFQAFNIFVKRLVH